MTSELPVPKRSSPVADKPHWPVRDRVRRLLGPFYVTGIFWYRAIHLAGGLPDWMKRPVVSVSAFFFYCTLRRIRKAITGNLAVVLGPCGFWERQKRIYRTLYTWAWCFTERQEQFRPGFDFEIEFDGHEAWADFTATDKGFVFFTAHFGNYEIGPLMPLTDGDRKVHVVREAELDEATQRFTEKLFANHPTANFVVHYAGDDVQLGAKLLMALRRGDIVAVPGDRPRASETPLIGEIFGRPFKMPRGPATLARAAGVQLLPVFVIRNGRRKYRLVMHKPFAVARTEDRDRDIREAAEKIAREIEWAIRERPHHWFCWSRVL